MAAAGRSMVVQCLGLHVPFGQCNALRFGNQVFSALRGAMRVICSLPLSRLAALQSRSGLQGEWRALGIHHAFGGGWRHHVRPPFGGGIRRRRHTLEELLALPAYRLARKSEEQLAAEAENPPSSHGPRFPVQDEFEVAKGLVISRQQVVDTPSLRKPRRTSP